MSEGIAGQISRRTFLELFGLATAGVAGAVLLPEKESIPESNLQGLLIAGKKLVTAKSIDELNKYTNQIILIIGDKKFRWPPGCQTSFDVQYNAGDYNFKCTFGTGGKSVFPVLHNSSPRPPQELQTTLFQISAIQKGQQELRSPIEIAKILTKENLSITASSLEISLEDQKIHGELPAFLSQQGFSNPVGYSITAQYSVSVDSQGMTAPDPSHEPYEQISLYAKRQKSYDFHNIEWKNNKTAIDGDEIPQNQYDKLQRFFTKV